MNSDLAKIKALIETDLLDSEPEKMFDDIAEIASKICEMPIALLSLLDIDRQFFKSNLGINLKEAPIEQSFCKIAFQNPGEILIVEDARLDARFKNNLLVKGYPLVVSYYGVPLTSKDGISYGTLCVMDNKVKILNEEQKQQLLKLSKQVEHLIELKVTNKLLKYYQAKIELYSKNMEEFAYLAAHDLKAPIRKIDAFAKLLEKKYLNLWDIKDKKYFSFIHDSSKKMNELISDLLEYSKSNMDLENAVDFDLQKLIVGLFDSWTYGATNPKLVFICNEMPTIYSSKIAFTVLFTNLINNAIKYQKINSTPKIEINWIADDTYWIFTIKDNGIGIEPEYFDQIFKPFKRLHSSADYQGNGLGLAACIKIIDKLKGQISVNSIIDEGTTFTLKIPKT
jgi:signal transduction histidine kinase